MLLYNRENAVIVTDTQYGQFEAGVDGGFDVPEDLGQKLAGFPQWETQLDRGARLLREEADRRKDPSTLLGAVEQLVAAAQSAQTPVVKPRPRKPADPATPAV